MRNRSPRLSSRFRSWSFGLSLARSIITPPRPKWPVGRNVRTNCPDKLGSVGRTCGRPQSPTDNNFFRNIRNLTLSLCFVCLIVSKYAICHEGMLSEAGSWPGEQPCSPPSFCIALLTAEIRFECPPPLLNQPTLLESCCVALGLSLERAMHPDWFFAYAKGTPYNKIHPILQMYKRKVLNCFHYLLIAPRILGFLLTFGTHFLSSILVSRQNPCQTDRYAGRSGPGRAIEP